ncbi:Abi family protein [Enterococcus gilvus]|uniref:Abortive infection bacteriophage resistance protein n=1 Tax=Enterococcus gilvus ATCC BAA-350 TaxID=1158614 RepID=R2VMD3_9ENTE|nr:Abi family protein [Enterococcus gilvus]EOI58821.1 hypothetical protein UKC_00005 [Enterococcus gilvus ATCC BAA-350]EOW79302.1 hypothetical protein I592_03442 [Enterococcus gilvus ATCC BAA-350]OJG44298.1 hypothetical protein RV02_GL001696 [Enterococcus gilvus]
MKYDRCATTIEEQVDILENRGLIIEDRSFAISSLRKIGYFRFKGYCLPFYKSKDKFMENVTFFTIYQNYRFDERFRLLLFQIIEHVEVELKSVIARDFALETSPLGFYDPTNFERLDFHESWLEKFKQLTSQSSKRRELYTDHYIKNYDNIFPIWVAMEMSDFGSLSKFFYNINRSLRNKISKENYGFSSFYLSNWIYVLSVTRNVCAHNGRIYDRIFPIQAQLSKKDSRILNNRAFVAIYICYKICLDTEYFGMFKTNLANLIGIYEDYIDIDKIGFPENWEEYLS